MGFPKAQWLKNSSLPAYCTAGHVTPQIFMLSISLTQGISSGTDGAGRIVKSDAVPLQAD
jgi:hypothetical protein